MTLEEVISRLKTLANPENVSGMSRYGANPKNALGVPAPALWKLAKEIGKDHDLAAQLWRSGIREARVVACVVEEPKMVTGTQLEEWVADIDSWDVCDCFCGKLVDKTLFAYNKASEWSLREEEFVKRAGFALMAYLAVHDKIAPDETFEPFLRRIKAESNDERNFVKKSVNWALRQIGKRNMILHGKALRTAELIKRNNTKPARWIAADAIRELSSDKIIRMIKKRKA